MSWVQQGRRHWTSLVALTALLTSAALLSLSTFLALRGDHPGSVLAFLPMQLTFAATGALIAVRRPRNPVGWLFVGFGLLGSFAMVATAVSGGISLGAFAHPTDIVSPLIDRPEVQQWAAWIATLWTEFAILPILLALLVFPSGTFLSRRWVAVAGLVTAVNLIGTTTTAISDVNFHNNFTIADPVNLVSPELMSPVYGAYQAAEVVLLIVVAAGMVARYRRSDAVGRAQLTWVTFAVAILVASVLILLALNVEPVWGFIVCLPLVPAAVALAILRYRLFDIDRIISRTATYTLVTAMLVSTYAAIVTATTALLPESNALAVAAATLTAAALARPLLRHVQRVVDRRFNRSRYDAQNTVDTFASSMSTQVADTVVLKDLERVVATTLEPAVVGVWLRDSR